MDCTSPLASRLPAMPCLDIWMWSRSRDGPAACSMNHLPSTTHAPASRLFRRLASHSIRCSNSRCCTRGPWSIAPEAGQAGRAVVALVQRTRQTLSVKDHRVGRGCLVYSGPITLSPCFILRTSLCPKNNNHLGPALASLDFLAPSPASLTFRMPFRVQLCAVRAPNL